MRFCLIGPSGALIPPSGWGAVESLIWDYFSVLKKEGHQALILNCDICEMVNRCDSYKPDVVHIMYDDMRIYQNTLLVRAFTLCLTLRISLVPDSLQIFIGILIPSLCKQFGAKNL